MGAETYPLLSFGRVCWGKKEILLLGKVCRKLLARMLVGRLENNLKARPPDGVVL
jgi:hypothetical protein